MRDLRRPAVAAAAVLACVLTLAGCGGGGQASSSQPQTGHQQHKQQPKLTPPAEPGKAPKLSTKPAGTVVKLPDGGGAWGIEVDDGSGQVAVALRGPGRLGLVDTKTHEARVIRAPGGARMLNMAAPGLLLFPAENKDALFEIALPSGKVKTRVPVGKQPHQAVKLGDTVYLADEVGGYLGVIRDGKQVATFTKPVQPGGITTAGGRVALVDVRSNQLFVYDTNPVKLVASLPAGEGPDHVTPIGHGRVAVSDVRGHQVITYDITGKPHRIGTASVPGRPFNISSDVKAGLVYASLSNTNKVTQFHVRPDGTLAKPVTLPTVRQPNSLDVDQATGTVYVAGYKPARVDIIPRSAFGQ